MTQNPFDRRSALAESLLMGGLGVLAANRPRPVAQGPMGFGEMIGAAGMPAFQHYFAAKREAEERARQQATEAAKMSRVMNAFTDSEGNVYEVTGGGVRKSDIKAAPKLSTKAPSIRTKLLPGGMQQEVQWDPKTQQWTPMGAPVARWKAGGGTTIINKFPGKEAEDPFRNVGTAASLLERYPWHPALQRAVEIDPKQIMAIHLDKQGNPEIKPLDMSKLREDAQAQAGALGRTEAAEARGKLMAKQVEKVREAAQRFGATGIMAQVSEGVAQTPAYQLQSLLSTLKANIGFQELQRLRTLSPTGGALGQVSDRENALLQSVLGSLDPKAGQEQFLDQLKQVEDQVEATWNATIKDFERAWGVPYNETNAQLAASGQLAPRPAKQPSMQMAPTQRPQEEKSEMADLTKRLGSQEKAQRLMELRKRQSQ